MTLIDKLLNRSALQQALIEAGEPIDAGELDAHAFGASTLVEVKAYQQAHALTPDGLYKALQKRAAAAGIVDFHPHILRHTFVTWMRAAKVPTEHVAAVTSHASGDEGRASVMERIYFHKESVAGAAVASVESVFAPLFC